MIKLDKQVLDLIQLGALVYNEQRLSRDQEVLKFVEWLYKEWGYVYEQRTK